MSDNRLQRARLVENESARLPCSPRLRCPPNDSRASILCTISSSASSPCPFTTTSTIRRSQRLMRQQRRMPSAQHHRQVRIQPLGFARDLDRFANHRPGHQRHAQAQRVVKLLDHALLVIRSDGRIDDPDHVTRALERRRQRQNRQGRGRFVACESREKEDDFLRAALLTSPQSSYSARCG